MKMKINSALLTKSLLVLAVFSLTTFITYGAVSISGGVFDSTPYRTKNLTADADLKRYTNGVGATILDGVIAKVKAKAMEKGGNPMDIMEYNSYIDSYLSQVDKLDNTTRATLGSDYAFLFQYIYPRVYELKKKDDHITSIVGQLGDIVNSSGSTSNTG